MNVYQVKYSADMKLFTSSPEWTNVLAENERLAEKNVIAKIKEKCQRQYKNFTGEDLIIHNIDIDIWEIKLLLKSYKLDEEVA